MADAKAVEKPKVNEIALAKAIPSLKVMPVGVPVAVGVPYESIRGALLREDAGGGGPTNPLLPQAEAIQHWIEAIQTAAEGFTALYWRAEPTIVIDNIPSRFDQPNPDFGKTFVHSRFVLAK